MTVAAAGGAAGTGPGGRRARLDDRYRRITASVIWQLLGRQRRWLVALTLLAMGSFTVAISVAVEVRDAVDLAMVEQTQALGPHIDALVGLAAAGLLVGLALRQVVARLGYHLEYELRVWVYDRLHAMHPSVLDALASGQTMTRAMSDLTMLELAALLVPAVAVGVVLLIALAVVIVLQDPVLGLLALISVPLNLWFVLRIRKPLFGLSWTILNRRAEVTTAIDEAVRGARVVKAFAREDDERARVSEAAAASYSATLNRVRLTARYELLLRAVPLLVDALVLVLGAQRVVDGRFSIGQLLIFLIFTGVFTGLARSFEEIVSIWQLARSGARRIFELLDLAPAAPPRPSPPGPGEPLIVQGEGLELVVEPGELVVLAGATSPRGLDGPGVLVLDDQPFFFSTSIGANLRMAAPRATDAELRAAIEAAAMTDVVDGLGGLDGEVGDRGLTLSGGQRQRLALARALLSPARVIVLHDALAAVNPALEVDIVRRVRAAFPDLALVAASTRPLLAAEAGRTVHVRHEIADPDDPARLLLAALAGARPEQLLPPELVEALATVPPERDHPALPDAIATDDHLPPSVPNLLSR